MSPADLEYSFARFIARGQDVAGETLADAWLLISTPRGTMAGFEEYGAPLHELENAPASMIRDVGVRYMMMQSLALHTAMSADERGIYTTWNLIAMEGNRFRLEFIRPHSDMLAEVAA